MSQDSPHRLSPSPYRERIYRSPSAEYREGVADFLVGRACLRDLRSDLDLAMSARRAEREQAALRLSLSEDEPAEPAAPVSPLAAASSTRKGRDGAKQLAEVKLRDAWKRRAAYPLTGAELLQRCERAVPRDADDQERDDCAAWLVMRVIEREGPAPAASACSPAYLERKAWGYVKEARTRSAQRAWREDSLSDFSESEDADEWQGRRRRSPWAAAAASDPMIAPDARASERAGEAISASLAETHGLRTLTDSEDLAIRAALAGWGSGPQVSAALGISAGAARKRLTDGRARLRARYVGAETSTAIGAATAAQLPGALPDVPREDGYGETIPSVRREARDGARALRSDVTHALTSADTDEPTTYRAAAALPGLREVVEAERARQALPGKVAAATALRRSRPVSRHAEPYRLGRRATPGEGRTRPRGAPVAAPSTANARRVAEPGARPMPLPATPRRHAAPWWETSGACRCSECEG